MAMVMVMVMVMVIMKKTKMNKKVLITGTSGFIGFHLSNRLVEEGFEVVGLDSVNDYYDANLKFDRLNEAGFEKESILWNQLVQSKHNTNHRFVRMDLQDEKNLEKLFKMERFDIVVNLAAQAGVRYSLTNPKAYIDSNIVGFTHVLENCRHHQVQHLVYASSSSVYGLNSKMPLSTQDNVDHPIALYAASKKSNELMAHAYSHLYGFSTTGLRFFTVYGPWGRPDMALFLFTEAILKGQPIKIFNHGKMIRDFTYIDDIVEGIFRVINQAPKGDASWNGEKPNPSSSSAPYRVYNIGNNNPINLMDFIAAIEKKLGKTAEKIMMPIQAGDVPATYADVSDLVKDLDYQPKTKIDMGINAFVDWFTKYYG